MTFKLHKDFIMAASKSSKIIQDFWGDNTSFTFAIVIDVLGCFWQEYFRGYIQSILKIKYTNTFQFQILKKRLRKVSFDNIDISDFCRVKCYCFYVYLHSLLFCLASFMLLLGNYIKVHFFCHILLTKLLSDHRKLLFNFHLHVSISSFVNIHFLFAFPQSQMTRITECAQSMPWSISCLRETGKCWSC